MTRFPLLTSRLVSALVVVALGLQAAKQFEPVLVFPQGKQEGAMGSFLSGLKDTSTVTVTLDKPYSAVWPAVKIVAQRFEKLGKRPVVEVNESAGRVQNGRIAGDSLIGSGTLAWVDQFITEATQSGASSTTVSVTRKLVQKGNLGELNTSWQTHTSNGKIERWLITEIMKEVGLSVGGPDLSNPAVKVYAYRADPANFIELQPDGVFRLLQQGKTYSGTYTVAGEALTLLIGKRSLKSQITDSLLIDSEKKPWDRLKADDPAQSSATPALSTPSANPVEFTNADILKLVEAKLPESLVISRIKASSCSFDTSADALIRLRAATSSDGIVQAVVECKK